MSEETIAAIATPPGRGGIGMVRLSGSRSLEIASEVIRLTPFPPHVRRATLGEFFDPASSRAIDQVVVTWFRAPHSYTGEDVLEICCHGAPVVLQYLLERCVLHSARLAEPGEFTMRAFLNGRIDLTQAEAIRDLIDSQTLYQARVAAQQMEGAVSARLKGPKEALVELVASLEAGIDFAEDDVPVSAWEDIIVRASAIRNSLAEMAEGYELGKLIRDGLSLAILGRPNVGKSSIFNRLINQDRAIVTDVPGTTRDLVSETTSLSGIPIRLIDTAGIHQTTDPVERIGVEKSLQALADTDLRLLVIDASVGLTAEDAELYGKLIPLGRMLIACNKSDLPPRLSPADLNSLLADRTVDPSPLPPQRERGDREAVGEGSAQIERPRAAVWVSALTGTGMPELQEAVLALA
ncbi:MAG: tRNA uridine-5-carboxymethylaminomethyl(34) synthesis GTPase MnmE, partial [Terriglobia bacterium]